MGCSARTPVAGSGVVPAAELVDGVGQQGFQYGQAVPYHAGLARQIDDQCPARDSGEAPGERGRRHLVPAVRPDRLGDAGHLVVEDGAIVERGTHDELLAAGGRYEELHRTQFEVQKSVAADEEAEALR